MFRPGMKVIRIKNLDHEWKDACDYFKRSVDSIFSIKEVTKDGLIIKELLDSNGHTAPGTSVIKWSKVNFKIVDIPKKTHLPKWF